MLIWSDSPGLILGCLVTGTVMRDKHWKYKFWCFLLGFSIYVSKYVRITPKLWINRMAKLKVVSSIWVKFWKGNMHEMKRKHKDVEQGKASIKEEYDFVTKEWN